MKNKEKQTSKSLLVRQIKQYPSGTVFIWNKNRRNNRRKETNVETSYSVTFRNCTHYYWN